VKDHSNLNVQFDRKLNRWVGIDKDGNSVDLILPTDVIPEGDYCYGGSRRDKCPYWYSNEKQPYQLNGGCKYLNAGDWVDMDDGGTFLLWDQVKECGINAEYSDEL
jgi:hypothetical protein